MSCIHDIGNINVYTTCHVYVTLAAKGLSLDKNNLGIDFVPNFVTPKFFVVNV